jgi:hypothetical protein
MSSHNIKFSSVSAKIELEADDTADFLDIWVDNPYTSRPGTTNIMLDKTQIKELHNFLENLLKTAAS